MRKLFLVTLSTLSLLSFSELDSLNQLQKQAADLAAGLSSGGRDLEAASYLMGKFKFGEEGKPTWYPEYYPTSSQMEPGSGVRPRVKLLKPVSEGNTLLAPLFEVFKKKNPSGSCEINLSPPYLSFVSLGGTEYCMDEANEYDGDESTLASLQKLTNLSAPDQVQSAFISVLNMDALSEVQRNKLMTDPNASIKTILDGLSSDAQKQALVDPRRIQLLKYNAHKDYPLGLGSITAQVGSMTVDIPVDLPPEPRCLISRLGSGPIQPGDLVQFKLEVNSITREGSVFDRFSEEQALPEPALAQSNSVSFGSFKSVHTFSLKASVNSESRINGPGSRAWDIYAKVSGVRNDRGFHRDRETDNFSCQLEVSVEYAPPVCTLAAARPNILAGESTQLTLDCRTGGPVSSAEINGISVQANGANPSFTSTKMATVSILRTESVQSQEILGEVIGRDGTSRPTVLLGKVCDFNDPSHQAVVVERGQWAQEAALRGRNIYINEDPISFSRNHLMANAHYTTPVRAYLLPGQKLTEGQRIKVDGDLTQNWQHLRSNAAIARCAPGKTCDFDNKCRFEAIMQENGNFVVYNEYFWARDLAGRHRFNTGPKGAGTYLVMQTDGNLVMYNSQNQPVWNSSTFGTDYKLELRGDGWLGITNKAGATVKILNNPDPVCSEIPQNRYNFSYGADYWGGGWSHYDRAVAGFDMDYQACSGPGETNICMVSYFAEPIPPSIGDYVRHGEYTFHDGQTYRVMAGYGTFWAAVDARDSSCAIKKVAARTGGCFTPDTQIQMANGSLKLASDITENDFIFNPHYNTGIRVRKVVKGPEKKSLFEVKTSKGKVEVTEDHPFLTARGWVQAMALKKGDKLLGNGEPRLVSRVKKLKYQGPQDVWNFELDTEDPMAHVVIANGIPTGDLVTQLELKKPKSKLP